MTVLLEGLMTNKVINGIHGDFSVGSLKTEVGIFKIRNDDLLAGFDEGEYQVKVAVSNFGINVYSSKRTGIAISEILAEITAIDVIEENKGPVTQSIIEPDVSVEKQKPKVVSASKPKAYVKTKAPIVLSNKRHIFKTNDRVFDLDNESEMKEVFGLLWPLADSLKQDNTVNRVFLEVQRKYLNYKGYVLEFTSQTWSRS